MDVIRVRNPNVLMVPQVQMLLKRALATDILLAPGGLDTIADDLFRFTTMEEQIMLLGAENGEFKSIILGYLPNSLIFPYPTVILAYNEGSKVLFREMKKKLLDFFLSAGYTRAVAVNGSEASDKAWVRVMQLPETQLRRKGSLYLVEVK